jgi:hypothetical protein
MSSNKPSELSPISEITIERTMRVLHDSLPWLEEIIAPYVTDQETDTELFFQGKHRYLDPTWKSDTVVNSALCARHHIESFEERWKSGDIDMAICDAMEFVVYEYEIEKLTERRNTRLGKRKLNDVPKFILEMSYGKHRGKRNWLQLVTKELIHHCGGRDVGSKTVRNELRERGIVE